MEKVGPFIFRFLPKRLNGKEREVPVAQHRDGLPGDAGGGQHLKHVSPWRIYDYSYSNSDFLFAA